jgi:coatomer subunit beta'
VGDCFIYCNNAGRLNYSVGGKIQTLVHLDTKSSGTTMHSVLGYLAKEDRVYLVDKSLNIISYRVMMAVLQYQTAVMRGDFDSANALLPNIPQSEYTTIARFLEAQGFKEEALEVTMDDDHKFDLSLELGKIDVAHELMTQTPPDEKNSIDTMTKWKKLSDAALKISDFELTEACSLASDDFPGLLLLYSAVGNFEGMEQLAEMAQKKGKTNIAFVAYLLTGNVEECANLLIATNRLPEAAFFARTYLPSRVEEIVSLWKDDLSKVSETAANALADPASHPELFPDRNVALQVEKMFLAQRNATKATGISASDYPTAKDDLDLDLIALVKSQGGGAGGAAPPPPPRPPAPIDDEAIDDAAIDDAGASAAAAAAEAAALAQAEAKALAEALEADCLAQEAEQRRLSEEAATEEAARIAAEEEAAAAKAAENVDDFGDDW